MRKLACTTIACLFAVGVLTVRGQDVVFPGSTIEGDVLRGQGQFLKGAAWYELNKAQADALNAKTMIAWNRELSRVYAEEEATLNEAEARKKAGARARKEEVKRKVAEREDRLRTKPTSDDIIKGDALNALLVDLSDPAIGESSWRGAKVALPNELSIRSLVFQFAPKRGDKTSKTLSAGVIALSRLDVEGRWPVFLRSEKLAPEREAYDKAYGNVRDKSLASSLDLESVLELDNAVEALKAKVASAVPAKRNFQSEASHFVADMKQATRMFDANTIGFAQEMLADTQRHEAHTVGELLAFMRKYRLLFANADKTPTAGQNYGQLFHLMGEQSKKLDLKRESGPKHGVDLAQDEYERTSGTWTVTFWEIDGRPLPKADFEQYRAINDVDKFTVWNGNTVINAGKRKLYPTKTPREYDLDITTGAGKGTPLLGIYELEADTMTVCFDPAGKTRPAEFKSQRGTGHHLIIQTRMKR
jgi:uncharacterized protein (TIGR03067 family)